MRWLLVKDLQILRRSPLLVALLVLYPIVVALLIGLSFSRGPDRPKVAVVNELDPGEKLKIGDRDAGRAQTFRARSSSVSTRIQVATREQAIEMVEDGEVLAALIVPEDLVRKLETGLPRGAPGARGVRQRGRPAQEAARGGHDHEPRRGGEQARLARVHEGRGELPGPDPSTAGA